MFQAWAGAHSLGIMEKYVVWQNYGKMLTENDGEEARNS